MTRHSIFRFRIGAALCALILLPLIARGQEPELVNIKDVDSTIVVDLRYATSRNIAGRPLYPRNMPALLRPSVAERLAHANRELRPHGYKIKVWDAYRPKSAHDQLWQFSPAEDYVANPSTGGSLHTWGVAADVTLVDSKGKELKMPTDFDDFTPAAWLKYTGSDPRIRRNLRILQSAMARAGFFGMRTEWWHFISKNWTNYRAYDDRGLYSVAPAPTSTPPARAQQVRPGVRAR